MEKLNDFDSLLLSELERDGRQTFSKIAKKLNTSEQVISYKVKSFEKKKIVEEFYTVLDISKLGYTSFRTMIRFNNITEVKYKEIIDFLMKQENILWIVDCGGRWDMIVNILAKNVSEYYFIFNKIRSEFSNQILNYDVLLTLQGVYFGRDYFSNRRNFEVDFSFGMNYRDLNIDNIDLQILDCISENARINAVYVANKLNVSSNTVISRIKDMKKKEIIISFKPLIHLEKIGYKGYKALLKFQNANELREKEIIDYLRHEKNVVGVIRLVGAWDFEIEFEVKEYEEMLEFSRRIRDTFLDIIRDFEIVQLYHEYKYNFFPRDLLKNN